MNELQDKQYLALELTKTMFQYVHDVIDKDVLFETYSYFVSELTGLYQDLETVKSLQEEVKRLQGLLKISEESKIEAPKLTKLKTVLNESKGDMEPYIYDTLIKIIGQ